MRQISSTVTASFIATTEWEKYYLFFLINFPRRVGMCVDEDSGGELIELGLGCLIIKRLLIHLYLTAQFKQ